MDYDAYVELAQSGGKEFESGDLAAAEATFRSLIESDIADLDKSAMCMNVIIVAEKRGAPASEVEGWYDRAIAYERPLRRYGAIERKADWLATNNRNGESLRLYEEMLGYVELSDGDRARVRLNCESLRSAFNRYSEAARSAAALLEAGKHDDAIAAFREIVAGDLSDIDRSMMCCNIGRAYDLKNDEHNMRAWYERGMEYERPHFRFLAAESFAYALSERSHAEESIRTYEELLRRKGLTEADKSRFRGNIESLRTKR